MTVPVSVVVLTLDESVNIERCLLSVIGWCQTVHVVDSGSTDGTLQIARRYTDSINYHEYLDHASQLTWVLEHIRLETEWVLLLDADNEVTPLLRDEIARVLNKPEPGVNGYYCPHRYYFRGKRVRGFKPWSMRLVRHSMTAVDDSELVDFRLVVRGKTGRLKGALLEYNAKEDDVDFWIDKHQQFATRIAIEEILRRSGYIDWGFQPKLLGNPDERIAWLKNKWYNAPLFVRPFVYFSYRYFIRFGFLDGVNGLIYHFLQAFWFRLLIDIKMADLYDRLAKGSCSLPGLAREFGHASYVPRHRESDVQSAEASQAG